MKSEESAPSKAEKAVEFYRAHPVEAARDLLQVDPIWYQRIMLRNMWFKPFVLLNCGRGSSKTWIFALFAVLKAMLYSKMKVGIIAPGIRQANFVFDEIENLYTNSPFFRKCAPDGVKRLPGQSIVRFQYSGSFVEALPLGNDGSKIRGRRYNVALCDEMAQIPEEIVKLVIRPMLNIKIYGRQNQLIQASTAYYKWNHFWGSYCHFRRMEAENPSQYFVAEYDYRDILMVPNSPFQVDEEIIKMQFADQTPEQFAMEALSKFPDEGTGFFPSRLIESCTPRGDNEVDIEVIGDKQARYVMGIDCAREPGGANFACAILKLVGRNAKLVNISTLNGETFQAMHAHLRRKCRDFNIIRICNDAGGGGGTLRDLFSEPWLDVDNPFSKEPLPPIVEIEPDDERFLNIDGVRILEQTKFTNELKNQMYNNMKSEMHHKRYSMPIEIRRHEDPEIQSIGKEIAALKTEMMAIQTSASSQGLKFEVPAPYKMDRITAVVLAMKAALDIVKAEILPGPLDELPDGLWAGNLEPIREISFY